MPGVLCEHCTAMCCRYIALPIEKPRKRSDFDDIRWYLLHEGVSVFVEEGEWYICVTTNCRHLQADHRCGIYETRPRICREYSTDNCDYHSGDYGWEQHFTCPEHLDEYVRLHGPRGRGKGGGGSKSNGRKAGRGAGRPGPKVRLGSPLRPRRGGEGSVYAGATVDVRGVPLPVLGAAR